MKTQQTSITILPINSTKKLPLYEEWGPDVSRAWVSLDIFARELYAFSTAPHQHGWTDEETTGHVQTYGVFNNLTANGINDLLSNCKVQTLCRRICDGAKQEWTNTEWVTVLNDDAAAATEELRDFFDTRDHGDFESLDVYEAAQYFDDQRFSELVKPGESFSDAADRLVADALQNGVYLSVSDVTDELKTCFNKDQAIQAHWLNLTLQNRVDLCRDSGVSIFAARRASIPEAAYQSLSADIY